MLSIKNACNIDSNYKKWFSKLVAKNLLKGPVSWLYFLGVITVSLLILGISVEKTTPRPSTKAAAVNALFVRVSKSYVTPGGSYTLIVLANKKFGTFYYGNLEVSVKSCDVNGGNCQTSQRIWQDYDGSVINVKGTYKVNIPSTAGQGVRIAKFRPAPNPGNMDWSNEIQINISTTYGLQNTKDYWLFWLDQKTFYGRNNVYGENFTTQMKYEAPVNICGIILRPMVITKNNVYGYWNPAVPWYNQLWDGTPNLGKDTSKFDIRFQENLRWYLMDWTQKPGWDDTWLTAYGFKTYKYLTTNPLSQWLTTSLSNGSLDPSIPNYFLTPLWIGEGWGQGMNKALTGKAAAPTEMCNVSLSTTPGVWSVHGDFLTLTTPKGSFPALRLKFYEGDSNYLSGGNFLREDWWFIKGQGLVRIETKEFGNNPSGYGRLSCQNDDDFSLNDIMVSPQVTLTRSDYN